MTCETSGETCQPSKLFQQVYGVSAKARPAQAPVQAHISSTEKPTLYWNHTLTHAHKYRHTHSTYRERISGVLWCRHKYSPSTVSYWSLSPSLPPSVSCCHWGKTVLRSCLSRVSMEEADLLKERLQAITVWHIPFTKLHLKTDSF